MRRLVTRRPWLMPAIVVATGPDRGTIRSVGRAGAEPPKDTGGVRDGTGHDFAHGFLRRRLRQSCAAVGNELIDVELNPTF